MTYKIDQRLWHWRQNNPKRSVYQIGTVVKILGPQAERGIPAYQQSICIHKHCTSRDTSSTPYVPRSLVSKAYPDNDI